MLPPISGECPTLFREPLHFIVIAVMSVIPLYLWGFLHDGELLGVRGPSCHPLGLTVTVSQI